MYPLEKKTSKNNFQRNLNNDDRQREGKRLPKSMYMYTGAISLFENMVILNQIT